MRKLLTFLLVFRSLVSIAQDDGGEKGLGLSLGYSINKTLSASIGYISNKNGYYIGIGQQNNGQKGKVVDEQKPNYGNTITGSNYYYQTVDLVYERSLLKWLSAGVMANIGAKKYFTNYKDGRFNGGGYHMVTFSESKLGAGTYLCFYFHSGIGISAGYSTIKSISFDLRIKLTN